MTSRLTSPLVQNLGIAALYRPEPAVSAKVPDGGAGAGGAPPAPPASSGGLLCTGLSFSDNGAFVASSHADGSLNLWSGDGSAEHVELHSFDWGCRLVTFTHHESSVLHTSRTTGEHRGQIVYHSLHDNRVVRFFRGHMDLVSSIAMSPTADTFLSVSRDGTFRVWDLREARAVVRAASFCCCCCCCRTVRTRAKASNARARQSACTSICFGGRTCINVTGSDLGKARKNRRLSRGPRTPENQPHFPGLGALHTNNIWRQTCSIDLFLRCGCLCRRAARRTSLAEAAIRPAVPLIAQAL